MKFPEREPLRVCCLAKAANTVHLIAKHSAPNSQTQHT